MSETSTCRASLAKWCIGSGLDIGFGGDPIVRSAICIDRAPGDPERAPFGDECPTHLVIDAFGPLPFKDDVLDYVYSSHTLEDAVDTAAVLEEWCRVIKPGGHLVLLLPDQSTYVAYCQTRGTLPNQAHKHADFCLTFVVERMPRMMEVVHTSFRLENNPYSFELIAKKHEAGREDIICTPMH